MQRLEDSLESCDFLVGESLTLADISLVAYTRMAPEGGLDLNAYPKVKDWIGRVEKGLALGPYS